jgi:cell volume regulation protein A
VLQIESLRPLGGALVSFHIVEALPVAGERQADLPFPEGTAVVLIVRASELLAPRGSTTLLAGDHVYVFGRTEDQALVRLLFGQPESP